MKVYTGVDCGATYLRVGLVEEGGQLLASTKVSSPLKNRSEEFAQVVKFQVDKLVSQTGCSIPTVYGVGTPGPLDIERGLILPSSNLGNTTAIDLKSQFTSFPDTTVFFDRDTNIALLGESWQGAAVGKMDVVMLTLGSGVGGALMINGKIELGAGGKAGEIGHMYLDAQNPKLKIQGMPRCGLGHEGCFESLINSAKDIDELSFYLGYGLANIVDIFNPEMIVIGGGKLYYGDFLPKAREVMQSKSMKEAGREVEVVYAKLHDLSGVYGGAKLALERTK